MGEFTAEQIEQMTDAVRKVEAAMGQQIMPRVQLVRNASNDQSYWEAITYAVVNRVDMTPDLAAQYADELVRLRNARYGIPE